MIDTTEQVPKRKASKFAAPKVLLTDTTGFPGAAQLAISLAKAACDVSAVCPIAHHPFSTLRAVRQKFPYSSLSPLDSLREAIESVQPEIIIPCDDLAVQHLHELHAHAAEHSLLDIVALIERSLGSPQSYRIVRSRHDLLKLASGEGLRVPRTSLICTLDDLNACCVDEAHPLVLKADGTWGGNGVRIAHSRQQAREFFVELNRPLDLVQAIKRRLLNRDRFSLRRWCTQGTPEVVAQEYIAGRPANCAVFCWKGRVLAGNSVEVVATRRAQGPACVVRMIDGPEMLVAAERLARSLQISGFFGLDFIIEDATGTPYLIEMNPRCTRLCHLQLGKGRDMAAALYSALTARAPQERSPVTHNALIAYFPEAWMAKSEFLSCSYHDIPQGEPALICELLGDSTDRTPLGQFIDRLRTLRADKSPSKKFSIRGSIHADVLQPESRG